ncbi:hypothetical protein WA171_004306 [Blastocystis sp. BT1]
MKFSRLVVLFFFIVLCLAADAAVEAAIPEDDDNIDDILDATIEEPEEVDDDVSYDADEEEPMVMKAIRMPVHPLTDIPEPSSDIEVTYKFLTEDFPVAEPIRVIVNLKNTGVAVYNITNCMGSLNDANNFAVYHQNFTERNFNSTLYPGYEMNFLYVFGLYNFIDPQEYQMALTIFYETDSDYYATTFFNETVEVVDHSSVWDIRLISIVAMLVVGVMFLFNYCSASKKPVKNTKSVEKSDFLPKDKKKN